jgi:hypothetical protein
MGLFRLAFLGATGYAIYKYAIGAGRSPVGAEVQGLCATFPTREGADLAVEHLVQVHDVGRAFVYVEPVADENSAGTAVSGGDHASGAPGEGERTDAPLHGAIQVTVPADRRNVAKLKQALVDAGATEVETL